MKNLLTTKMKSALLLAAVGLTFASCSKDDKEDFGVSVTGEKHFQVAYTAMEDDGTEATYIQGLEDLSQGSISFNGFGYRVPSTRTSRFYSSSDGKIVYTLDYPVGDVTKYEYKGGQNYAQLGSKIAGSVPLGVAALRMTKIDETYASLHAVGATASPTLNENSTHTGEITKAQLGVVNLKDWKIEKANVEVPIDLGENLRNQGYYVFRIDAPVVVGGKAYYGCGLRKYDLSTGKNDASFVADRALTLVVDWPSLENAKVVSTTHIKGSTNGYRTPMMYRNESGDILQLVSSGKEVTIAKIKNGAYDETFKFNLTSSLGTINASNGWFYVGNGIGYVPYKNATSGFWGLVRINLNNNTVVDLEVPAGLDLTDYQNSVAKDGKFYIALAPTNGGAGNIYAFDINSTSPNAYTKGANITTTADRYFIGIF